MTVCLKIIALAYETQYPCTRETDHEPPCKHKGQTREEIAADDPTVEVIPPRYAEGGLIPPRRCTCVAPLADRDDQDPDCPTHGNRQTVIIDRGYILVDADTYDRLGPDRLRELNDSPAADIEIYLTADQARARHGIELDHE